MNYEHEDYEISRFVGEMLRHANCYRKFPMNAMGYSPYVDVRSIVIGSLANKARIEKKRAGVSRCNFPGFLRGLKSRFTIIAKRQRGGSEPNYWTPWMSRVIEGHTISMINDLPLAHVLTRDDMERMPALCHGTSQNAVPSILYSGLRPMGRNHVMFLCSPTLTTGLVLGSDLVTTSQTHYFPGQTNRRLWASEKEYPSVDCVPYG